MLVKLVRHKAYVVLLCGYSVKRVRNKVLFFCELYSRRLRCFVRVLTKVDFDTTNDNCFTVTAAF